MTDPEAFELSLEIVRLMRGREVGVKDGTVVLLGVLAMAEFEHEDGEVRALYPSEVAEIYRGLLHNLGRSRDH